NHTRRYLELSKASTHSRNTSNEKIVALNAEIAKMKPSGSNTKVSGPKTIEKPKVLAPGMYGISSKYITPPRRGDWAPPAPRKKHVTFQEPPKVSTPHTKQPAVNNHKQPNVNVILSKRLTPVAKVAFPKTIPKNVRKTVITVAYRIVSQWKPTSQQFILCDIYGPKKSKAPTAKPLELSLSVSSSSPVNVISRFSDCQLSCSRHMTGDRSKLINYMEKFVGIVRFENNQFAMIVGYGDYKMGIRGTSLSRTGKPIKKVLLMNLSVHRYDHALPKFNKRKDEKITTQQTVVATSPTEAEYVAAASCCAQVLWIQN
nr:putative ribonuclease H-like domain-containing protein [Tanacetum cinerariifolium]